MESISRYTILRVWAVCVENRSSYEARDLRRKFAINCRGRLGFLFTLHKIAVSDPARGSNPTFLLGQKRRVRPASWGWWFASTLGKKASQTRLSGRTRELGLSVNAVLKWRDFNLYYQCCQDQGPPLIWSPNIPLPPWYLLFWWWGPNCTLVLAWLKCCFEIR